MVRGIDISEHNGVINWSAVKSDGIGFAILRDGYGRNTLDSTFYTNVQNAKKVGVHIDGVYHFSYALNTNDARNEADVTIKHAKDAGLGNDIIIFFDLEYDSVRYARDNGVTLNSAKCIEFTNAFCNRVKELGYKAGVYANGDYYYSMYNAGKAIPDYAVFWYADWRSNPSQEPKSKSTYWQYSESGKVNGIGGNVDLNYRLKDVSFTPMKKLTPEEIEKIAKEVLDGKWGNGQERVNKLTNAGYEYSVIQAKVEELIDISTPKKEESKTEKKPATDDVVSAVIAGKYGNGDDRKKNLEKDGYDYNEVQNAVNKALTPGHQSVSKAKGYDGHLSGTYEVLASALNLRYIPGLITTNNVVKLLYKTYRVKCWGYYTDVNGERWLLIQDGNYTGFVDSKYVKKL